MGRRDRGMTRPKNFEKENMMCRSQIWKMPRKKKTKKKKKEKSQWLHEILNIYSLCTIYFTSSGWHQTDVILAWSASQAKLAVQRKQCKFQHHPVFRHRLMDISVCNLAFQRRPTRHTCTEMRGKWNTVQAEEIWEMTYRVWNLLMDELQIESPMAVLQHADTAHRGTALLWQLAKQF